MKLIPPTSKQERMERLKSLPDPLLRDMEKIEERRKEIQKIRKQKAKERSRGIER